MERTIRKTHYCKKRNSKQKYQVNTESTQSITETKLHKEARTLNLLQAHKQSIVTILSNQQFL